MITVELVESKFEDPSSDEYITIPQVKITDVEADYTIWLSPQQADTLIDDILEAVVLSGLYDPEFEY